MSESKKKNTGNLWTIVALLVFSILLMVGYKLRASLVPDATVIAPLDISCDLRKSECWSDLPSGGKISLAITPKDIPTLTPLELTIVTDAVNVSSVEIDFVGVDMNMGYNHTVLVKSDNTHFKGTAIIPVCVASKMTWEARVMLQTDTGVVMAPFRFHTLK